MKTFLQEGTRMNYTPVANVTVDQVLVLGDRIGVAVTDIPAGTAGAVAVSGVFRMAATAGEGFMPGQTLYWDAATGALTTEGSDGAGGTKPRAGFAWVPKVASAIVAEVKID